MGRLVDPAVKRVRKAVRRALARIGRILVADIRQSINVPVQYEGSYVIRSDPGEPPRREYKVLWKSIKYRVRAQAATVEDCIVYTNYIVAVYLEYGTRHIEPRPFWEPARKRAKGLQRMFKRMLKEELENVNQMETFATDDALPESQAFPEMNF